MFELTDSTVCTDNEDANDDTNDDDAQSMTVKGSLVDEPNKPKSSILLQMWVNNISYNWTIIVSDVKVLNRSALYKYE